MRLIDADELERKIRWYGGNTAGLIPQYELSNAPTVKAVPIEWLKRYAKKGGRIANILFPFEIEMMLEDWEKENE